MAKKQYIYAPGPVNVPPRVLEAIGRPVVHHRSPLFDPIFSKLSSNLKEVFQTKHPVVTIASSGTGAFEAALTSTANPGDKVLSVEGGKFGQRWGLMAEAFGLAPHRYEHEWGTAPDVNYIADYLKNNPDTKAVYVTLCETSAGTLSDVKAIAAITKNLDAVLIVDAISGLAADVCRTDEWGIDMVVTSSQKGLMCPPGLGFVSVNDKAAAAIQNSKCPQFYFSLKKALKQLEANTTPFTPSVNLIYGATEATDMLIEEGIENVWNRHARLAAASRAAMEAINCKVFAQSPANTVTTVSVPEGVEGGKIVKTLREKYGMIIAGGQDHLKGKIFRFATLGYYNEFDALTIIQGIEMTLDELGHKFEKGNGTKAAMEYLAANPA